MMKSVQESNTQHHKLETSLILFNVEMKTARENFQSLQTL